MPDSSHGEPSQPLPPELPAASDPLRSVLSALGELVLRCLAKERGERPASVAELIAVFDEVLGRYPWGAKQAAAWWTEHVAPAQ